MRFVIRLNYFCFIGIFTGIVLSLSGCSSMKNISNFSASSIEQLFGESMEDVEKALNINMDKVSYRDDYNMSIDEKFIYDDEFVDVELGFTTTDAANVLISCAYSFDDVDTAYQYLQELYSYFIEKYGETEIRKMGESSDDFSNIHHIDDITKDDYNMWFEYWNINRETTCLKETNLILKLSLTYELHNDNSLSTVRITYSPQNL